MNNDDDSDLYPMSPGGSVLTAITRGEIAERVETARRFPRSLKKFIGNSMSMVTVDQDAALSCAYAVKRADGLQVGPSIRFAEIVRCNWGNNLVSTQVIDQSGDFVIVRGSWYDMEENSGLSVDVSRSIVGSARKGSKRYSQDMIATTTAAASSIAMRNAILSGIPRAIWWPVYQESRLVAVGDIRTLSASRTKALDVFGKMGVVPERVFALLGVTCVEEITLDHVAQLRLVAQQIKDESQSPDDFFPPLPTKSSTSSLNDRLDEITDGEQGEPEKTEKPKRTRAAKPGPEQAEPEPKAAPPPTQTISGASVGDASAVGTPSAAPAQSSFDVE